MSGEIILTLFLIFILAFLSFIVRWEERHDEGPPVLSILSLMISLVTLALSLVFFFQATEWSQTPLSLALFLASSLTLASAITVRGIDKLPFLISILLLWSLPFAFFSFS